MMGEAANESTQELCRYIRDTWMTDGLWAPHAWCVFRKSIRTNNDVEGMFLFKVFRVTEKEKHKKTTNKIKNKKSRKTCFIVNRKIDGMGVVKYEGKK